MTMWKTSIHSLAMISLLLAACGGSHKPTVTVSTPSTEVPPGPPPSCAAAGDRFEQVIATKTKNAGNDDKIAARGHEINAATRAACETDIWSPEAVTCFARMDQNTVDGCASTLTPSQQKSFEDRMSAISE